MIINIKKALCLIFCITFLSSCDFLAPSAPLGNEMLEFYSDESNLEHFTGVVRTTIYHQQTDTLVIAVELSSHDYYSSSIKKGCTDFALMYMSKQDIKIEVSESSNISSPQNYDVKIGDKINCTSALFHFYNGHIFPLLQIERDGVEYLSLEKGKKNYFTWIENEWLD